MIPPEIAQLGVAVPGLPHEAVGFTAASAAKVFQSLLGKVAVGSINVFDRVQWGYAPSDDEWRSFRRPNESATDFAIRTRAEALRWVMNFPGSEVLFEIALDSQDEAAEAVGPA